MTSNELKKDVKGKKKRKHINLLIILGIIGLLLTYYLTYCPAIVLFATVYTPPGFIKLSDVYGCTPSVWDTYHSNYDPDNTYNLSIEDAMIDNTYAYAKKDNNYYFNIYTQDGELFIELYKSIGPQRAFVYENYVYYISGIRLDKTLYSLEVVTNKYVRVIGYYKQPLIKGSEPEEISETDFYEVSSGR